MKYCTKCGKEIKEEAKFCDSCGEAITKDKKIETKPKDKKNNKKIIIIGTIILFVIIIGTIILSNIIYNNKKVEDYEKFEEQLEVAGENYIKLKGYELDKESNIIIKDIEKANLINNELTDKCDGYVLIEKDEDEDGDYDYNAYIKCGNKYKTKGYNHTYSKKSYINLDESTKSIDENDNSTKDINEDNNIISDDKSCPNYVTNLSESDLISEYKFETKKQVEFFGEPTEFSCYIDISLYKNNLAFIDSNCSPQVYAEKRYAKYTIANNLLTITRLNYYKYEDNCFYDSPKNLTDEFNINSDGSLYTDKYNGQDSDYTIEKDFVGSIKLQKIK